MKYFGQNAYFGVGEQQTGLDNMGDDYDFFLDPNPDWFCKSCGQLFNEDELNENGLCPDCAEFEAEYDDEDGEDEEDW